MSRITRNSRSEPPFDAPIMLDYMCHGWYSRETLRNKLGSGVCEQVLRRASRGAQDGMTLIYDGVNVESRLENIVYIRSPSNRAFDRIRLGVAQWMKLCRWFLINVQCPEGQLHYLYESREVDLSPLEFRTTMDDAILLWVEQYSGESETITSDRKLAKLLRLLDRDGKLCGPSSHLKQCVPADYNSGSEIESIPDSFTGCAPTNHIIGPFGENRERNADGTFAQLDPQLTILYGCVRSCLPQVGSRSLTHSLAVITDLVGRIVEMYLNERGHNLTLDLVSCVPTSPKFWCKATEHFANKSILRHVVGIVKNGGIFSMSSDGGKRNGRNLFPVTASYFDKEKKKAIYSVVTSGFGGSTGKDAGDILYHAVRVMNLMRDCCIEYGVLDSNSPELQLALMTADGGPDMQRTLCLSLAGDDKLGYETSVIHCFMHTHSLLLATAYTATFGEGHKPDLEKPGVMSLLKGVSWIMSTKYPAADRKKLVEVLFSNDIDDMMHEDTIALMEELGELDDVKKELSQSHPYVVMMTRWGTVGTALSKICKNWKATQELLHGISAYDHENKVSEVSNKLHEWMAQPVLHVACEFMNTFCELWYSPWYHMLLSNKDALVHHEDRHMVAGFRCGEMVLYCAAMEIQLASLVEDFKTAIADPDIELPVIDDKYDGPMLHRPAMHAFRDTWKHFKGQMPHTDVAIQTTMMHTFLEKAKECLDQYHQQWFTKFFFTALDSPDARVRKFTKSCIESAQQICSMVHNCIDRPDIQLVLTEQKNGLNFIVRNHRVNNSGDAKLKLFWWCPNHSLDSLFEVLETKLVSWVSVHIERMVSPGSGRTRQTPSLWPVLERFQQQYPDNWETVVAHAVAGTQLHNQLSERNVGNAARVAHGKKSLHAQNQSSLVVGSTVVRYDKYRVATGETGLKRKFRGSSEASKKKLKVSESSESDVSESHSHEKSKRTRPYSYSATSSELSAYLKLVEQEKLSNKELEAIQMFMKELQKLNDEHEPSRKREQQLHEEGSARIKESKTQPRSEVEFISSKEIAAPALKGLLKFTKITHEKAVELLNQLFPKETPWVKKPRESNMIKTTLKRLAKKADAIERDERGAEYLNIRIEPRPYRPEQNVSSTQMATKRTDAAPVPAQTVATSSNDQLEDDYIDGLPLFSQHSLHTTTTNPSIPDEELELQT